MPDVNFYKYFSSVFGGNKNAMLLGGNVRRSSRRVKPRGEREFLVNSDMLLRDLKVMVSLEVSSSLQ